MPLDAAALQKLFDAHPELRMMAGAEPIHWKNPLRAPVNEALPESGFSLADVQDAAARLERFAPCLAVLFPELREAEGIIESPLRAVPAMQKRLGSLWGNPVPGRVLLKMDSHLPVSGSIKARGGIYEVLCYAERLALESGRLKAGDNYARLAEPEFREFFNGYSLAVGSTGNLGLSVGIMGAALGLKTTVHMSSDARQWKKDLLRSRGVTVAEYAGDYSMAVAAGRATAEADPNCWFVDDEDSANLFLGYAVAGLRLGAQLDALGVTVSQEQPLVAYLPCGVGGGPGGVAFGLKLAFGDNAVCCFSEPTEAPAVAPGLISGLDDGISGADLGLSGKTAADGLAVSRPSALVCKAMRRLLDGVFTVRDDTLFHLLHLLAETEAIHLEPSALAGFPGILHSMNGVFGAKAALPGATHLAWATGGSMVPSSEWEEYNKRGAALA